jgi:hypothetical protein
MTKWIDFVKKITKLPENKGLGLRHSLKQASKLWKKMKPSAGGKSASKSKGKKIQGGVDTLVEAPVVSTTEATNVTTEQAKLDAAAVTVTGGRSKKHKCSKKCKTHRRK